MVYTLKFEIFLQSIFTQVHWHELSSRQQILFALQFEALPDDPDIRTRFEALPPKLLATLYNKYNYFVHIKVITYPWSIG